MWWENNFLKVKDRKLYLGEKEADYSCREPM